MAMRRRGQIGRLVSLLVLLVGIAFVFPGCEKSSDRSYITQTDRSKERKKKRVAKTPPPKKAVTPRRRPAFSYNPEGKVDPFKPFIQIASAGKSLKGVPKTPLQEYDLSQLKLTAIIWMGGDESRALVEDSAGKGFTLRKGTYIGSRGGRVKAIHMDRVIIEEPLRTYGEQTKTREIVMKMPAEGGKK